MLKREFEKSFCVWGFFKEDKLIAFYSAWKFNGTLDMYYIGFDYESNRIHNLYFNMLFFGVATAIDCRCKTLIMGRTALEAKARLGCEPKYLYTFLFIKTINTRGSNCWALMREWGVGKQAPVCRRQTLVVRGQRSEEDMSTYGRDFLTTNLHRFHYSIVVKKFLKYFVAIQLL